MAFTDFELAQNLGIVALAHILFEGGLSSSRDRMRSLLAPGLALATAGVAITAGVTGAVAALALDLPWTTGLLLGAIVSSTDVDDLVPLFFTQMLLGAMFGLPLGWVAVQAVNRLRLEHDGLYPVISLTMALPTYGCAAALGGSGFLAVYLAGMVVGNAELLHRRSIDRVHAAVAWLCQIAMFLVLGLLVFPSRLDDIVAPGLLIAATLVLLARPIAVMSALALSRFDLRERAMVSWVGLRGAVPIILATFALVAEVPDAQVIFDVVFFVVLVSVLVQGAIGPIARLLGVAAPAATAPRAPLEATDGNHTGTRLHQLSVEPWFGTATN